MTGRRTFLGAVAGYLLTASVSVQTQQVSRTYRIGLLVTTLGPKASINPWWKAFIQRMNEHGWVENRNFVTVVRRTEGGSGMAVTLAKELVAQKVDLIVAGTTEAALAAKEATHTIPIVGAALADPVGAGLVSSLARPGENVTGMSFQGTELAGKQLGLLKELLPELSKVAVLVNPANASNAFRVKEAQVAALALKLRLEKVEARHADELKAAFDLLARNRDRAVLVLADPLFLREASRIASLANLYRVPAMYGLKENVLEGGLVSYGASFTDLFRRTADYVDKIIKGANPGDLPIEQPTNFEFIVNLRTAKALGLTIPQSLLVRADEIIE